MSTIQFYEKKDKCDDINDIRKIYETFAKLSNELSLTKNEIFKLVKLALFNYNPLENKLNNIKAYAVWTEEEENIILSQHKSGVDIKLISEQTGRSQYAIKCRLNKLGIDI